MSCTTGVSGQHSRELCTESTDLAQTRTRCWRFLLAAVHLGHAELSAAPAVEVQSAQRRHVRADGRAASRFSGMASPQLSQIP